MRKIITTLGALLALAVCSNGWGQSVFLKYGPVAGIQKSTGSTYQNTAAASTDVVSLWSGTCTVGNFLQANGVCAVPGGVVPSGAANLVYATPNGSSGSATLRALVGADQAPINLGSTANGGVSSATILLGTNGGTSNGFFSVTGPATALKTFTFPNASATVLTSNAAVTVAQGGTGLATLTANGVLLGEGASNVNPLVMGADTVLRGTAAADPVAAAVPNCGTSTTALSYNTTTHAFGCQTITGAGGNPAGSTGQMQYNNGGTFGGDAGFLTNAAGTVTLTNSTLPVEIWKASSAGTDLKNVQCYYNVGGPVFNCTFVNDALSAEHTFLSVSRGTGTTVTGVILGNSTDLPAITVAGSPTILGGFMTLTGTTNGFSWIDTTAATTNRAWSMGNFSAQWHLRPCNDNVSSCGADAISIQRSVNTVTGVTLGNSTDSAPIHLLGAANYASGFNSQNTGTVTNVFTVPAFGNSAWLATCSYGSAQAVSWVFQNGGTLTISAISTNGTVAVSLNGGAIACTQTSGSTQSVNWGAFRFGG